MNEEKILQEIKTFLKKTNINPNQNLRELGIDSLDLLDLILDAEEKFNIKITDEELLNLNIVQDVINVIKSKL